MMITLRWLFTFKTVSVLTQGFFAMYVCTQTPVKIQIYHVL